MIERIYVNEVEGEFINAQWKVLAATFSITETTDGQKLANALRKLAVSDNQAVVQQVIALTAELVAIEADIFAKEDEMNAIVDRLYGLSEADIKMMKTAEGKKEHLETASRVARLVGAGGVKAARESA